jgi:hypothetical protein
MTTPVLIGLLIVALIVLEAMRLLDWPARRREPIEPPGVAFPLRSSNSFTQVMTRVALGIAVAGGYLGVLLHFLDRDMLALAIVLPSVMLPLPAAWAFRRMHTGTVELRPARLFVRTKTNTQSYPWHDVEEVTVATWAEASAIDRLFIHATGVGFGDRFVQLRLRRPLRIGVGIFHNEFGTDVPGLPTTLRIVRIFAEEPGRVAAAAQAYVAPADPTIAQGVPSI